MLFRTKLATPTAPPEPSSPMRAAVRFPLALAVTLHVGDRTYGATTVDVSSTGMQFVLGAVLDVGSELDWELSLPAAAMGTAADIRIVCHGRVVWVQGTAPVRMAVVIDEYRIKEHAL